MKVSIIIPALNEAAIIGSTLFRLQAMRWRGHEVIVVDGGSDDETLDIAAPLADVTLRSETGRAVQMHAGASSASGDILWFLHADTHVPDEADQLILTALGKSTTHERHWGRFNIRLSGNRPVLRIIALLMNLRSRLSGIATGDQGIFVRRVHYEKLGGFPEQPLMEDIELCRKFKRISPPLCIKTAIVTSSRRWEERGVIRTVLLMWLLRAAYSLGIPAARLARLYD